MNLLGRAVQDPLVHLCEVCLLPVLIYGRMVSITDCWLWLDPTITLTVYRNAVDMHSVVTVPRRLEECVHDVRRETRPSRKLPWAMCTSVLMEEGGKGVEGEGSQSLSSLSVCWYADMIIRGVVVVTSPRET